MCDFSNFEIVCPTILLERADSVGQVDDGELLKIDDSMLKWVAPLCDSCDVIFNESDGTIVFHTNKKLIENFLDCENKRSSLMETATKRERPQQLQCDIDSAYDDTVSVGERIG